MRLREIDRLRGIAVLMTFWTHARLIHEHVPECLRDLWSGVDLFFVISGFVVSQSLVRLLPAFTAEQDFAARLRASGEALGTFFRRRAFRIAPLLLACLALPFVFSLTLNRAGAFPTVANLWPEALAILGGFYNYSFSRGLHGWYLAHYWSLAIEEQFYAVLPFVFILAATTSRRLLSAAGAIGLVVLVLRPIFGGARPDLAWAPAHFDTHLKIDALAVGVLLGLLRLEGFGDRITRATPFWRFVLVPLALGILMLSPWLWRPGTNDGPLVSIWASSGLLVFLASLNHGFVLKIPGVDRVLDYVGTRSYAFYLSHVYVLRLHNELTSRLRTPPEEIVGTGAAWFQVGVILLASLAFAEILHQVVEKPFMAMGAGTKPKERIWAPARWLPAAALVLLTLALIRPAYDFAPKWHGTYYATHDFTGPAVERDEPSLSFDWGKSGPFAGIPANDFSARWTTVMTLDRPREFAFELGSDDGARLIVDGTRVIDDWTPHGFQSKHQQVTIPAGTHAVTVEFYQLQGDAALKLRVAADGAFGPHEVQGLLTLPAVAH